MSISQYWEDLLLSEMLVETPKEQAKWRNAISSGDIRAVSRSIRKPDIHDTKKRISPSMPTTKSGENPLVTIAKSDIVPSTCYDQAIVAKMLIAQGCEITVPDKFKMLPADYAMLSGNKDVTETIVLATIQRLKETARDYLPNVQGFFATCSDRKRRFCAYNNLIVNHRRIAYEIMHPHNDLYINLSDEEMNHWSKPYRHLLCDMPYPNDEIMRANKITLDLEMIFADIVRNDQNTFVSSNQKIHRTMVWSESRSYRLELAHLKQLRENAKDQEFLGVRHHHTVPADPSPR